MIDSEHDGAPKHGVAGLDDWQGLLLYDRLLGVDDDTEGLTLHDT